MSLGQIFNTMLWLIKDHAVNTETGFLYLFNEEVTSHQVTSNSRQIRFTNASGKHTPTKFTSKEIDQSIELMSMFNKNIIRTVDAQSSLSAVNTSASRIERFIYFLQASRSQSHLPSKIALYCTMLETLLSTSSSEITHKISERAARMIGETPEKRIEIYNTVKKVYKIRSSIVHGSTIDKKLTNQITDLSIWMDDLLRKIFIKIIYDYNLQVLFDHGEQKELEEWFTNLIFE
ncbi:hypothetical protein EEL32_01465 [Brevibacillus laterosporus]|nr:HEPN domain-containing protein [Brevibacillus laterosporus]TPG92425.1 hypothetical protein EEL32_01465 [Brevibacillus laterosporus]